MSAPKQYDSTVIDAGQAGGPCLRPDFRIFRTNLLQGGSACITDRLLPYAVFIDPQLGRIELSERAARRQGRAEPDDSRSLIQTLVDPAPAPSWAPPSSESRAAR